MIEDPLNGVRIVKAAAVRLGYAAHDLLPCEQPKSGVRFAGTLYLPSWQGFVVKVTAEKTVEIPPVAAERHALGVLIEHCGVGPATRAYEFEKSLA